MQCPDCDSTYETPTPFCIDCGATFSSHPRRAVPLNDAARPVLCLRPVFSRRAVLRSAYPVYAFLVLWGAFLLGGAAHLTLVAMELTVATWIPFALAAVALALVVPTVGLFASRRAYERSEFRFLPHRLEYVDGASGAATRALFFSDIQAIELLAEDGELSRDVRTILLSAATGERDNVWLHDVEDAERVAATLRALVAECSTRDVPAVAAA